MEVSNHLTQEELQEILVRIYQKGNEEENISSSDLIREIKQYILQNCMTESVRTK